MLLVCVIGLRCSSHDSGGDGNGATAAALRPISTCGDVTESVALTSDLVTTDASCLTVKASNLTIDGGGHRITAGEFAVQWVDESGVTVKNVVSDQDLQIYGDAANRNVVRDCALGSVAVFNGDDNVIENSSMRRLAINGLGSALAEREVVNGNHIEDTLTKHEEKLVAVITGSDGSLEGDGTIHCGSGEHQITNNEIIGTVVSADPTTEPELLHIRCGTHSTFSGNTIRSNQRAAGILLRDGADENLFENNDVRIGDANEGALFIQSGTAGAHHPRNNTFRNNVFRADSGRSLWLQANATRGNQFFGNLFRGEGGVETVRLTDGTGVDTLFDHNTFYRAQTGTLVVFRDLGPGTNRFVSNVFAHVGGSRGIFDFDHLQTFSGYQGDDNVFFNASGPVTFGVSGDHLCQWRSRTGQDGRSTEGDPRFIDPSSGDFHIDGGSAARCTGDGGSDAGAYPSSGNTACATVGTVCP